MPIPTMIRLACRPAIGLLVGAALLTGCTTIAALTDVSTPLDVYDLRAPDDLPVVEGGALALDVIIEEPTTSGVLNTDRILIRPDALQAQYLPDARWGDETPVMVQTLMVRALEATGGLRYVGREPLGLSGDFAIISEIVDFQAEIRPPVSGRPAEEVVVVLRIMARMVRESDASIVSSRMFRAEVPVASADTAALLAGFDAASDAVLAEFTGWVMGRLGRRLTQG